MSRFGPGMGVATEEDGEFTSDEREERGRRKRAAAGLYKRSISPKKKSETDDRNCHPASKFQLARPESAIFHPHQSILRCGRGRGRERDRDRDKETKRQRKGLIPATHRTLFFRSISRLFRSAARAEDRGVGSPAAPVHAPRLPPPSTALPSRLGKERRPPGPCVRGLGRRPNGECMNA